MDVKNVLLNDFIEEEVYVEQPRCFENFYFSILCFFKLRKTLYGLKQTSREWYEHLNTFLIQNEFKCGKLKTILFRKDYHDNFIIVQIYIDDIIFYLNNELLYKEFSKFIWNELEMSMMRELKFFLGLQIKQVDDLIYIH